MFLCVAQLMILVVYVLSSNFYDFQIYALFMQILAEQTHKINKMLNYNNFMNYNLIVDTLNSCFRFFFNYTSGSFGRPKTL